jgi:hypothetical protein
MGEAPGLGTVDSDESLDELDTSGIDLSLEFSVEDLSAQGGEE